MWFVKVDLDMLNRELNIKVMETQDNKVLKWIATLGHRRRWQEEKQNIVSSVEELTLTDYTGTGEPIYKIVFKSLGFEKHLCDYDYASNDVVTHQLVLSFGHFDTIPCHPNLENSCQKKSLSSDLVSCEKFSRLPKKDTAGRSNSKKTSKTAPSKT